MQELMTITEQDGQQVVSARDLHRFLKVETPLTIWMPRMLEYGFEEGKDLVTFLLESNGDRPTREYSLKNK
jgi:anti-repressor protein